MAINEACQLWIEQRIKEELEARGYNGKSLRAIGREIAQEIERIFEAKVEPRTLEKRAERRAATNVAPHAAPTPPRPEPGDSGDKVTAENVRERVLGLVDKGKSIRDASEVLAKQTGQKPESIRKMYAREQEKHCLANVTEAMQFARMAISQLERIRGEDPKKEEAFSCVIEWITQQRAMKSTKKKRR